eukprot:CAMPEP_0181302014 /NCGR_PEP_ID=MMETSP1101-20121128/7738_1 /TAXON_ID=46948 /ORGANISM="Rhodomonas abbreviata, Strain Caron Lab Isolate" /LENGTH=185 /DNA_ID=CAMNT_0023407371 /DNA_START=172 /DNA_END=725 /DNA_ORIENTATION=+
MNMSKEDKELWSYYNKKSTPMSMKSFAEAASPLRRSEVTSSNGVVPPNECSTVLSGVACFLHREIPIRLAHMVGLLQSTPSFAQSENMQKVCGTYKASFSILRGASVPNNPERRQVYTKLLSQMLDVHSSTLVTIAKALHELKNANEDAIQQQIDKFYLSRIGIRMLATQYLELCKPPENPDMVG